MRVDVGQDGFVFQVPKREVFLDYRTPTLVRIHAYACTPLFLEPSAKHSIPLADSHLHPRAPFRDKYLYHEHPLRLCGIRIGHSCSD